MRICQRLKWMVPRVKRGMTRKISKNKTVEPSKMSKNETVKPSKISKNKRVEASKKSKNQTVEPPGDSEYQSEYICNFHCILQCTMLKCFQVTQ